MLPYKKEGHSVPASQLTPAPVEGICAAEYRRYFAIFWKYQFINFYILAYTRINCGMYCECINGSFWIQ